MIKSQCLGVAWSYLDPLEVTRWQILNRWMYDHAVGRYQTKVQMQESKFYMLRACTNIIDEVSMPSGAHVERVQQYTLDQYYLFAQVRDDLYYIRNESKKTKSFGVFKNDLRGNFSRVKKAPMLDARNGASICNYKDSHVVVTGGWQSNAAEIYSIASN